MLKSTLDRCNECGGKLIFADNEVACSRCGLVHMEVNPVEDEQEPDIHQKTECLARKKES